MDDFTNNERKPFRLGVTGGIGCGKTSVCKVFGALGIPVFYADPEAKSIMDKDPIVRNEINQVVGEDVYLDGILDRKLLAKRIYSDKKLLGEINQLVHPHVFRKFNQWADLRESPYVIVEAAILFESGIYELVDRVVTVVAPIEERISRVMKRNKHTREQVERIIANQMDDETKVKLSYYMIKNADDDMIIPSVLMIHQDILNHLNK